MMKSAGVRFVEIPYKGTQAQYTDLLAGRIDLMFSSESAALPHIATGRIKGIAIAGPRRSSRAPDIPTMAGSGMPGLEMEAGLGCSCRPRRRRILWSVFVMSFGNPFPRSRSALQRVAVNRCS